MKMSKENCIKFFNLIIEVNGKPTTEKLIETFGKEKGNELARNMYISNAPIMMLTDKQIVSYAKTAKEKML